MRKTLSHVGPRGRVQHGRRLATRPVTAREAVARGRITMSRAGAAADSRRRDQERRSAPDGAARRHHGRQADIGAHSRSATRSTCRTSTSRSQPVRDGYALEARVRTTGRTGVEMEALTAVAVAALTIYDMVKAVDKAMVIGDIRLVEKRGGRSGEYRA